MLRVVKVKHLSSSSPSSIESLSHQFLQRCSVSGTAKGKGKAAATLKRSKITTKKGDGGDPSAKGATKKGTNEAEAMVDRCLNAPTPLRHLKPKQQAREDERKKLGLKSKVHEIEAAMLKKGKEKLGVPEKPDIIGTPGLDLITLGLVDADLIPKYELTVEDGRMLAKEYSRVLMRKHRERQAAETTFLRLKKEATEALPEHLKAPALIPDLTPFPANRYMATLTPPIEGYIEKVMEAAAKKSASKLKEKLR